MLRSSHKVVTLRLGVSGYAVSPGSLRGGAWQSWPGDTGRNAKSITNTSGITDTVAVETHLAALKLANTSGCSLLDVVLDCALTRVQVIRFPAGVRKPAERSAFLKAAFRNVFGRDASTWHVIAEPTYVSEPTPAVAIDDKVMQAIAALAERHQLKLRSLRTRFTDSFNSFRRKLSAHMGAFALMENGRICVGLWRHRSWIALSTQAFAAGDAADPADTGEALARGCARRMLARVDPHRSMLPAASLRIRCWRNQAFCCALERWLDAAMARTGKRRRMPM